MHYDITQPVDTLFNTIEDLADLAEHATSPMSAQQQIDMAYLIFAGEPILVLRPAEVLQDLHQPRS
jgi:hypothetical protein